MPDISKILKEINRHTTGNQKVVYGPWFDTYHNLSKMWREYSHFNELCS